MLICLTGYRGTGKTTIGCELARRLNVGFIDTDALIEQQAGCSIKTIFENDGEKAFRDLEADIVAGQLERKEGIISLGGGAILRDETRKSIAGKADAVIWLKASVETIAARLSDDPASTTQRPNLTDLSDQEEIQSILSQRIPLYRECATLEVETEDRSPAEIIEDIMNHLAHHSCGGEQS